MADQALPLAGVRVADFGQGVAGPYCAMLLADHGAEVIKIEPPRGDWGRSLGGRNAEGQTAVSISMNRNKQSLTLDLTKPEGLRIAHELINSCRVVVESFRPDVMEKLGLDFDSVCEGRGDLVYCSINGFGPTGPYAKHPAGDSITQPLGGLMSIIGGPDDPPLRVGNVVSDMLAGMNAFQGVLLGLLNSRRSGECQRVQVSLLGSMLAFQAPTFTEYLMTGELPRRIGNDHPMLAPSGAFETQDGWVYFTVLDHMWKRFCEGAGLAPLLADARFTDNTERLKHREALTAAIVPVMKALTTVECLALLQAIDVPCSRINDYAGVMADPQVQHNAVFSEARQGKARFPVVKNPVSLQGATVPYSNPPTQGEHSRAVLQKVLGYSPERVDKLFAAGVVFSETGLDAPARQVAP